MEIMPVEMSVQIKTACIAHQKPTIGSKLITSGCRWDFGFGRNICNVLRGSELKTQPQKECQIGDLSENGDEIICAKSENSTSCNGDSGGKIRGPIICFL